MMNNPNITTMKERSNIPAGGMTFRMGARTGSVKSRRIPYKDAQGVPGRTGIHDMIARANNTNR